MTREPGEGIATGRREIAARRSIATVALVVAEYDEAIAWYTQKLGFRLLQDVDLGGGKRWVIVGAEDGVRLLLAQAATEVAHR